MTTLLSNVWFWIATSALIALLVGIWAYRLYIKVERLKRRHNEED